jgi:predicted TIM-barrel fold metal-dependent hydrolase
VASHPKLRSKFARPLHLEDVGLACPKLKLIIGHFAAPWSLEAVHLAMGFPEWRFDLTTSGSWDMEALKLVGELHLRWGDPGLKRLVLGTDGSGPDNLKLARETLDRLRKGGFTEPQLAQIAHRNGLDVLNEVL